MKCATCANFRRVRKTSRIGQCSKVIRGLIMTVKQSDHCDKHRKSLFIVWSEIKEFLRGQNG